MVCKKRGLKVFLALVLAFSIFCAPAQMQLHVDAASSDQLSDLQQKQKDLQQQKQELAKQQAQTNQKLASLKADKEKQLEYKNTLDEQMENLQSQIAVLNEQIDTLDQNITEKTAQIADKQADIDFNYEQLKERLCALYKTGEASNLQILLNSENVMDLANKTHLLKIITEHDTELINTLKEEMQAIADEKAEIEQNRQEVAAAKTELDNKRNELGELESEAQRVLDELTANEQSMQSESNSLAAQQKKIEQEEAQAAAEIDQWWANYYASQNGGQSSSGNTTTPESYVGGQFTWPVPGYTHISCGYSSSHKAIDINRTNGKSISGAPIVAANGGKVVVAGWHYSYGNYVMIDHGGGYSTLYAHASSLAVSKWQQVSRGQTIAYVGSTGNSTGPHLHFEIRVNGVRKNPFNWFS